MADVSRDVEFFEGGAVQLGLKFNHAKAEIITNDSSVQSVKVLSV